MSPLERHPVPTFIFAPNKSGAHGTCPMNPKTPEITVAMCVAQSESHTVKDSRHKCVSSFFQCHVRLYSPTLWYSLIFTGWLLRPILKPGILSTSYTSNQEHFTQNFLWDWTASQPLSSDTLPASGPNYCTQLLIYCHRPDLVFHTYDLRSLQHETGGQLNTGYLWNPLNCTPLCPYIKFAYIHPRQLHAAISLPDGHGNQDRGPDSSIRHWSCLTNRVCKQAVVHNCTIDQPVDQQ